MTPGTNEPEPRNFPSFGKNPRHTTTFGPRFASHGTTEKLAKPRPLRSRLLFVRLRSARHYTFRTVITHVAGEEGGDAYVSRIAYISLGFTVSAFRAGARPEHIQSESWRACRKDRSWDVTRNSKHGAETQRAHVWEAGVGVGIAGRRGGGGGDGVGRTQGQGLV